MHNGISIRPYWCSERISIRIDRPNSRPVTGNLEEIGEWSALVLTTAPFARGSRIAMSGQTHQLKGRVESWSYEPELGYFIEVRLDESPWSDRWFTPQHLLALWSHDAQPQREHHPKTAA
jgi:hypothetical protein